MFARQSQGQRAARNLATQRPWHRAARLWRALPLAAALLAGAASLPQSALAAALPQPALAAALPRPAVGFTKLTLLHGWSTYTGSASPAVEDISGIVYFKGAITTASSNNHDVPFVLPPAFRPAKYVVVPVDMCGATGGELNIAPTGVVQAISGGANSNATCFTSLDGASFALSPASSTKLTLQPGWTEFDNLYRNAAARVVGGIAHLQGEIKTAGTNPAAFTLPPAFRPSTNVYVLINLCTGSIGRLDIAPSGAVSVEAEGTNNWWMVQCGVSLDGASYPLSAASYTALTLQNGWINAPYGTSDAAARKISGIVHLKGGIATNGTNPDPFVLPAAFRPAHEIWVPADLCGGNKGRLDIRPDGVVEVQTQSGYFGQAACFTSLDGVSFAR
jgi:hypothetical protein